MLIATLMGKHLRRTFPQNYIKEIVTEVYVDAGKNVLNV